MRSRLEKKSRNKRLWLSAVLIIMAAAAAFTAYALRSKEENRSIKIGVSVYLEDDTFITTMMDSLKAILEKYELENGTASRFYLSISDAKGSQNTQNEQVERFLSLDYDLLLINPVDRTHAANIIDMAMDKDVPIVFFNREPVEADMKRWEKLYYVGTDPTMNGKMEGEIVVDIYEDHPQSIDINGDGRVSYIMIEGEFRHQDAVLRTEDSVQTIKNAGIHLEKLDGGVANWDRSQAAALAREYFAKYGDSIELIICNNDDMALGVTDVVEEMGLDFVNIVGIDGTPAGLQAIEDGRMLGTVVIDGAAQAESIFQLVLALSDTDAPVDLEEIRDRVMAGENAPAYMLLDEPRTIRAGMYKVVVKDS